VNGTIKLVPDRSMYVSSVPTHWAYLCRPFESPEHAVEAQY